MIETQPEQVQEVKLSAAEIQSLPGVICVVCRGVNDKMPDRDWITSRSCGRVAERSGDLIDDCVCVRLAHPIPRYGKERNAELLALDAFPYERRIVCRRRDDAQMAGSKPQLLQTVGHGLAYENVKATRTESAN